MLVDDLNEDSINEEFNSFVSGGKKKNPEQKPIDPEQKDNNHKKQVLKIKDKLKIIEYIEEGHSVLNAVEKFKVPRTTICTWLKTRDSLRAFKNTDKKTMHPGAQPKYKIKNEIISNLKQLRRLFNEDEYGEEDDEKESEE